MKTITQYQPMIFSRLAMIAQEQVGRRKQFWIGAGAGLAYVGLGLWLAFDTGYLVWHWQFWVMFAPLLIAGELAVRQVSRSS